MVTKTSVEFDPYMERKAFDETKEGVKGLVDAKITEVPRIFHVPKDFLTDKKPSASDLKIPTIDFASVHVDTASRKAVVEKVRYAAEKWGFFQVINHGVPLNVLEEIQDGVRRFHEEDPEVKKQYFSRDLANKNFVYYSNFDLYSSSFSVNWRDTFTCYIAPDPPSPEELPVTCRDAMFEYSKHVMSLGGLLFELLSEALGLESDILKSKECLKTMLIICHYYPPCPQPDLTLGISKHSDDSFLTILLQDNIGGLQVLHQDSWVDVAPLPGALIINIGDFLQLITNDKFVSLEHRVLANKEGPRISVASFFSSSKHHNSTVYGPMKELVSEENPPKYRDITIQEYTEGYFEKGCACYAGYTGNPYIMGGCRDIDECQIGKEYIEYCRQQGGTCVNTPGDYQCVVKKNKTVLITIALCVGFGVLIVAGVTLWLYKFIKKQRKINLKKKLFKRNGGLLLKQQLTSTEGSIEKTKVFTSKELEKATENFSSTRVLGQGGQGTVYKGMLVDGRIVAVKKSTVVDEDKLEEFINEVVVLSQINHRNIVKLIGCCLETEVPLLVYEFISNGNLFEHLHGEIDESTMTTWAMRLRIIIDIAGALSYLHSAAASPIFHRDVKSTNIMLDEKYRAKVSDFGTSRTVTVDHTHLTTVVSGTVGYVDPEYFQSSQFTDKSDVYSFGVVLVELITGEKPISFVRFQQSRTLATYFIIAMEENRVVDIIDPQIRDDCNLEQVMAASQLARRCLNLNGRNRPSMREVSMELERIRSPIGGDSQSHVHNVDNDAEQVAEAINIGVESCNNMGVSASSGFQYNVDTTSLSDVEPLYPRQTW